MQEPRAASIGACEFRFSSFSGRCAHATRRMRRSVDMRSRSGPERAGM
jgi:hypothetical protein